MVEIPEMKQSEIERREEKFPYAVVTAVVLILLPVSFYFLLLREPAQTLRDISPSVIAEHESTIQGLATQLTGLQKLQSDFRSLDQNIVAKITMALPVSKELPELIVNIHALVKSVGADIDSLQTSEAKSLGKDQAPQLTRAIGVQFTVGSVSYESMKSLVAKIMQNGRFLSIESVQYDPKESKASIAVAAYYLSQSP